MMVIVNKGVLSGEQETGGMHTALLKHFVVVVESFEGSAECIKRLHGDGILMCNVAEV